MRITHGLLASCALAILLLPGAAAAQATGTVVGQVIEQESNEPIPGVQVYIPGSGIGTLTDQVGRYVLPNVSPGTHQVRARLIGFTQRDRIVIVSAGDTAEADFQLNRSAIELNPVVVNAITGQEQRTRTLGTNVGNIAVDALPQAQITRVSDILAGRTAGVTMQGVAGTVGTTQRIRIRGANSLSLSNEPLIYVDGVLAESGTDRQFDVTTGQFYVGGQEPGRLNDINPNDIESIEVLKGPAASALYGTAAANGVILVTTKRGRSGDVRWTVYAEAGQISDESDYPFNFYSAQVVDPDAPFAFIDLDAVADYYGVPRAAFLDVYGFPNFLAQIPCPNVNAALAPSNPDHCTQDTTVAFNTLRDPRTSPFQTGLTMRYGASVGGGSDRVTYYVSGELAEDEGVVSWNKQERLNLRANLNAQVSPKLTLNINSAYTTSELRLPNNDNSVFSPIINGVSGSPFYVPDLDDEELPARANYGFFFAPRNLANLPTNMAIDRFMLGSSLTFTPLTWLTANANAGLDLTSDHIFETLQANTPALEELASSFANGYRSSSRGSNYVYTANGSAAARFGFRENLFSTTTLGGTFQRNLYNNTFCYGSGLVSGLAACDATTSLFTVDEDFSEVVTVGAFLRQEVAINDRLFLAASIRGDDNSAFGQDFGWIFYPSASVSWVIGEEEWFPRTMYLADFRIRAAYGESGLRPNFRDAVTTFSPVAVVQQGVDVAGVSITNLGNPNLEPERSREYEAGFDLGLFDDRLALDFTWYYKRSENALISRNVPLSAGLQETIFENLGSIRNTGIELELQALAFQTEDVQLDVRFTATTLDNEIVELGEGVSPIIFNRGNQRHQEGLPAGAFYTLPYTFEDVNGDGLLAEDEVEIGEDRVFFGPPLPTNTQSLSLNLDLFGWARLNTLFERRAGQKQLNYTEFFRCFFGFSSYGALRGCSAVSNPDAPLWDQARFIAAHFGGTHAGYIEDADFIKWREVSLTFSLPPRLTAGIRALQDASLTLAGRNLATWTDYTGLDPEITEGGGDANFSQNELATQPPVRVFTARLTFNF